MTRLILGASALGLAACGSSGSTAASRPQPPAPVVVSAIVSPSQVRLSPAHVRPGPILLTVTNQSRRSVAVRVARSGDSVARTAALNPQAVTQIQFVLHRGRYAVAAAPSGRRTDAARSKPASVASATLRVAGAERSAGGQVLQP